MPKHDGVFVPHRHCTETSGACFTEGRCLFACTALQKKSHEHQIRDLSRRLLQVELQLSKLKVKE